MNARPILVGEDNPYGSDPQFALYCDPPNSAGGRLQRIVLGISRREYIKHYERVNLCAGKWNSLEARQTAMQLVKRGQTLILFGRKVRESFGINHGAFHAMKIEQIDVLLLPHPSGRNLVWNQPGTVGTARALLKQAGCFVADGDRPWSPQTCFDGMSTK